MAIEKAHVLGGTAIKPVERHGLEKLQYLIYNKDTGEVFTRTPKSWALIIIFYIIYYTCLAAFWAAMLFIFFQTLEEGKPKWQSGIIGRSPGLGLRPSQSEDLVDSSIIAFKASQDDSEMKGYIERADNFLADYAGSDFDVKSNLGACAEDGHGFAEGKPCIFLKLNRIYGLTHDYYNSTDNIPTEPQDFPADLKDKVLALPEAERNQVWINCRPEYPADIEGIKSINYFPKSQGFPAKYFPYTNEEGYKSPLVAVQFEPRRNGQLLHIECRAYAGNIGYSRRDRIGIVHLEIMLRN